MGLGTGAGLRVVVGNELCQRDICWTPNGPRTGRLLRSESATPATPVLRVQVLASPAHIPTVAADRVAMCSTLLCRTVTVLGTTLQQDAPLFRSVWGWRRKTACNGRETPFLDVCLDKVEAGLAQIDVNSRRSVGTDCREEVL